MDDKEKDLMSMCNVINRCQYVNYTTFPFECNIDNNKELKDSETNCKNEWIDS